MSKHKNKYKFLILIIPLIIAVTLFSGCGKESEPEVPKGDIIYISDVSESIGSISEQDYRKAFKQMTAKSDITGALRPGTDQYDTIKNDSILGLINQSWLKGEAEERGIKATPVDIKKRFRQVQKTTFPTREDYMQFLVTNELDEKDVMNLLKLDIYSKKIRDEVVQQSSGKEADKIMKDFVKSYRQKWKSRTLCAHSYIIQSCSNYKKS